MTPQKRISQVLYLLSLLVRITERLVTISQGTNLLVGTGPARILAASKNILAGRGKSGGIPHLWDDHAAGRIVEILLKVALRKHPNRQ
jgi:UDP-N-acetylglucosamine 2-epimerase